MLCVGDMARAKRAGELDSADSDRLSVYISVLCKTLGAIQVESHLQEQLRDHLHLRTLKCC